MPEPLILLSRIHGDELIDGTAYVREPPSLYLLANGRYQQPTILNLSGRTRLTAVPGVTVDWDRLRD